MDLIDRYLELGLRLGRHVDGIVDSYFGPADLKARVEGEPLRAADDLRADAVSLRAETAAESSLDDHRGAWLDDQLLGVETYAAILAGETIAYTDEVERCFGVRPERVPEEQFASAHERLDELVPGDGTLTERLEARRVAMAVPVDALEDVFARVGAILRDATERRFGLPEDERFDFELVRDEPWLAYNYYLGELRSRIVVNVDRPISASDLANLVAHEAYPGHHTEHAWKEHLLVGDGVAEESLILVPTPQSMVSEGIAEVAWEVVADDGVRAAVEEEFATAGIDWDAAQAEAVSEAGRILRFVGSNAALMLHEDGASVEEVEEYIARWSPTTQQRAAASRRFLADPLWRAYASTYSSGGALARSHLVDTPERFADLIKRQTRVADLLPAVSSAS